MSAIKVMRTIKISISLLLLMSFYNISKAQTVNLTAGAKSSNIIFENSTGNTYSTQAIPGIHIGLNVDLPVGGSFYIQPGLMYSRKGMKQRDSWFAGSGNSFKVTASYIEVPLNVLYKLRIGGGKLLLGAGPYLGYGTGGKWEAERPVVIGDIIHDTRGDVIFKNDVADGEWGTYLYGKPLDYGANILMGYEFFDKISAQFNIQFGLANLQPDVGGVKEDGVFKNIGTGITIGYKL